MQSHPAVNGGKQLSGYAVRVARRGAATLTRQGYQWHWGEGFVQGQGTVHTPRGDAYTVSLSGILPGYPEGRCDCPFFQQEQICKHLYFGLEQSERQLIHNTDGFVAALGREQEFAP